MSAEITVEEWLAALETDERPAEDALTIVGWAEKMHGATYTSHDRLKTSRWIEEGLRRGWVQRASMVITELTGRQRRVVGFRLVRTTKGEK